MSIGLWTHNPHDSVRPLPVSKKVTVQGPSPADLYARAIAADKMLAAATRGWTRQWFVRASTVSAVLAARDPSTGAYRVEHDGFSCKCGQDHSIEAGEILAAFRLAHRSGTEAAFLLPGAAPFTPAGITLVPPYQVPTAALAEATAAAAGEKLRVRLPALSYFSRAGAGKDVDGLSLDVPRFLGIAADLTPERTIWTVAHEAAHLALFALGMRQDEAVPDAFADRWVSEHSR